MTMKVRIKSHELGLWFRHGEYRAILRPGSYWLPGRALGWDTVLIFDTLHPTFEHPLLDVLLKDAALCDELLILDLEEDQRAIVWRRGRMHGLYGPGRHAFWRGRNGSDTNQVRAEVFSTAQVMFRHPQKAALLAHADTKRYLGVVEVAPGQTALVYRDGVLVETTGPGRHAYWNTGAVDVRVVDLREQVADVAGQEIMTRDKVTLRLNLVVTWKVDDVQRFATVSADGGQALYRGAQLALRDAVGGRDLETLLGDKDTVGREVCGALAERAKALGAVVVDVGIRDVILPGEMKTILNQVIEARKRAEANVIRRREETAAARSQANTAKLLADNPVLARMKELEALQEILAGTKVTFLMGAGDLASQMRTLTANDGD